MLAHRTFLGAALLLLTPTLIFNCSATNSSELEDGTNNNGTGASSSGNSNLGGSLGQGGQGGFTGEECGKSTFGNEVPGSLLIILDRSGSMSEEAGGQSKWSGTKAGINAMTSAASPELETGLLPFPLGNFDDAALLNCIFNPQAPGCAQVLADGGCTDVATSPAVNIAPLVQSAGAISGWLGSNDPNGNTPTLYALKNGYEILKQHPAKGQRFALLITDGEPTVYTPPFGGLPAMNDMCGSQADIESEVLKAATAAPAINTFVIGSPGSEGAASFLSQLALNGNTAKDPNCTPSAGNCHYQIGSANYQQELKEVLEKIAGTISDCIFELPEGEDIDPNLVNVTIETDNGTVTIYKDPAHQDGWDYTDGTQTKIQLFGPACDLYKAQKGNSITIILGCESVLK